MTLNTIFLFFTALSFIVFGKNCLHKPYMILEFDRYQLSDYRVVVGILQISGGFGLLIGFYFGSWLITLASLGLFLLMLGGIIVRLRIKDSLLQSIPAITYALLSFYLFYTSLVSFK